MAPLLASLVKFGFSAIAGAVATKGREVIQEKLGIDIGDALGTEQGRLQLKQLEMQHEEFLINAALEEKKLDLEADKEGQRNVTERWKADMSSDSWLSKNVRPLVLLYLTACVTLMALSDGIFAGFQVGEAWISLLAQLTAIVYGAYFLGRTVEKGIQMRSKK